MPEISVPDAGSKDVGAVSELLGPYDAQQMHCYPVSARINRADNDTPE